MNLDALLSKTPDEILAPVPLPPGHYEGTILSHTFGETRTNKTPTCEFTVRLEAPGPDVDKGLLIESGAKLPSEKRQTFYLTEDAMFMLKGFLTNTLRLPGVANRPMKELIPEATNRRAMFKIKHITSERNGEQVTSAIIDGYAPNVD